jgi:hypothetical protein
MDPLTAAALAGGIGEFGGSVVGDLLGAGDRRKQAALLQQALRDIENTNAETDPSAYEGAQADPALVTAQRAVLERLMREGATDGLDRSERVGLSQAQQQIGRQERGSREAILQSMAARGMGGSGSELAAALTNQQGSADRSADMGASAAAAARQRQLAALSQSGQLSTTARGQDFGEKATRAGGVDAVNRFNAAARLNKAGMVAGMRTGQANLYGQNAERDLARGAGAGAALGQGIGYYAGGK